MEISFLWDISNKEIGAFILIFVVVYVLVKAFQYWLKGQSK